ncbi:chloride channel protein [Neorhizobium petrolearium]|uniref:Chloride channel protein n=1 Tax=Neorhizobium petrolearium TaxID=515361 RepID=A0ABY8M2D7_9HYPH|nr:chloride channel protein [Neorhizobium petrolearium]MCC2608435.1 chloride channel protein [Neorhizobium petrolearium]WGI68710.1 chloride channel protein [Neorhizobium petrolearium]
MFRRLLPPLRFARVLLDPGRLRVLIRRTEFGLIIAAAMVGIMAGFAVALMSWISQQLHRSIFRLDAGERLSSAAEIDRILILTAPIAGGILMGAVFLILRKWRKKPMVDPIEANALHGGRLSLTDSIIVAIQNLISNGFGASVGLEAGYTQLSSGLASKIGLLLQLRRSDLRILVGCGAAAAIAAAFNAPLTGAFYAFELIIGTYTILSLAPVVVSALIATIITRLFGDAPMIDVSQFGAVVPADYVPAIVLGIFCAFAGILLMQGVTFVEELARRSSISPVFRPALGGIVVGLLALADAQVLGAGHGALHLNLDLNLTIPALLTILALKFLASAVSIGSGFRGGLFFASLFMGALLGKLFAFSTPYIFAHATVTPVIYAVVGMSALAVAVIGGPLTMTFLALEVTGDFPITVLALAAVITSSVTVRTTFGYSFATWRFHLRGESIRSAHDIGWIRNLTVERMMRADVRTASASMSLSEFRKDFPLGSTQRVILTDEAGKYAGIILLPDIYAAPLEDSAEPRTLASFAKYHNDVLLGTMNAKQAAAIFDKLEAEALAVVNNQIERKVVGLLTESHTLRRYSEELDRRRREMSGEI